MTQSNHRGSDDAAKAVEAQAGGGVERRSSLRGAVTAPAENNWMAPRSLRMMRDLQGSVGAARVMNVR